MEIQPHPWNRSFAWSDHPGPHRVLTSEQAERFDRDGFFVLEGVLDVDMLERTLEETDAAEAQTEAFLRERQDERLFIAEAGAITFTVHLVTRSPWLASLVSSGALVDLCRDLVGPDVRLYWDQAVYKKPEKPRRFPWHQDNGYTYIEPQQYLTCWLALTDATVENGCPWVVPGVHRRGTLRHRYVDPLGWECIDGEPPEAVPAPARAGSAVVFSSLTPHMTGPNKTDAVRKAYIVQYAPEGAMVLRGDPHRGPPDGKEPCQDPQRQFPVLVGGEPASRP